MNFFAVLFSTICVLSSFAHAEMDLLTQQTLNTGAISDAVLIKTVMEPKGLYQRYKPQMDSKSELISGLDVGGTVNEPVLKMKIKSCVLFICQTVDFNGVVSVKETSGSCQKNYMMQTDLSRSGSILTDVYQRLDIGLCFNRDANNQGTLKIVSKALRSDDYSTGITQRAIFGFLQLQIKPMMSALSETLKVNASKASPLEGIESSF